MVSFRRIRARVQSEILGSPNRFIKDNQASSRSLIIQCPHDFTHPLQGTKVILLMVFNPYTVLRRIIFITIGTVAKMGHFLKNLPSNNLRKRPNAFAPRFSFY